SGSASRPADVAGAQVIRHTAAPGRLRLLFSEPINPATFTAADVTVTNSAGRTMLVRGVTPIADSNNRSFDITFDQPTNGGYQVRLGTDIRDLASNRMDQDGDGVNGEAIQDRFLFTDFAGPRVLSAQATWQNLRVTFSEPLDPATFT